MNEGVVKFVDLKNVKFSKSYNIQTMVFLL